ncbi:MAG: 16S rRNA (guanine(527)-N(7))-methyltransferase RsmG [Bacteroidales bacterium]
MEIIKKYFPDLTHEQYDRLKELDPIYRAWNQKINVISRQDMEFFYKRHVLHSMAILKVIRFRAGSGILDVGTGGGFPGIPLAICSPEANFVLVDSVGKKIKVVNDVIRRLGLKNVEAIQQRGENLNGRFDFVTSRAVKSLAVFLPWVADKIIPKGHNRIPNGVLYLKGGDVEEELARLTWTADIYNLADYFTEPFFETKKLIHISKNID